jgi:phosphatidylserine/phosphatidylglycerophosphate/cardiolipin synthase-like enzyme
MATNKIHRPTIIFHEKRDDLEVLDQCLEKVNRGKLHINLLVHLMISLQHSASEYQHCIVSQDAKIAIAFGIIGSLVAVVGVVLTYLTLRIMRIEGHGRKDSM